jgi:hypothetical protein
MATILSYEDVIEAIMPAHIGAVLAPDQKKPADGLSLF